MQHEYANHDGSEPHRQPQTVVPTQEGELVIEDSWGHHHKGCEEHVVDGAHL